MFFQGLGFHIQILVKEKVPNNLVKAVKDKYKNDPSLYGHSLGGALAEKAGKATQNKGNITTYNKGASPSDIFQRNPSNQTDVKTSTDLVSALSQFQQGGKKEEIQSNKDPLTAHNLDQLQPKAYTP